MSREREGTNGLLLPPHIRPLAFATGELALDVAHGLREIFPVDFESALILLCVNDATMWPVLRHAALDLEAMRQPYLPPEIRGSISRLMVADKTGLPRETVRRKIKELEKAGYLVVDDKDRVQIRPILQDQHVQHVLESGYRSVMRYLQRLEQMGLDWRDPIKR